MRGEVTAAGEIAFALMVVGATLLLTAIFATGVEVVNSIIDIGGVGEFMIGSGGEARTIVAFALTGGVLLSAGVSIAHWTNRGETA